MIRRYLTHTYRPEVYHGHHRRPPFFEGWYFKIVDAQEKHRYAIIPGIFLSDDPERHHAFIQVLDGLTGSATYHRFPAEAFQAAENSFEVRIGDNTFSSRHISLNIADEQACIQGTVRIEGGVPWPVSPFSPGIMGPFGLIPVMECYHGVVSLDHALSGTLTINDEAISFDNGRGYIEKDWGKSFPAGYLWMQTNHFHATGTSFVGAIAIIPWTGYAFPGFLVGFWHKGQLHRFATYTGAKTEHLEIADERVHWTIRRQNLRLHISAERTAGGLLLGPTREDMSSRVGETMLSTVDITLTKISRGGERLIFQGTGRNAGLEVQGDLDRLLALQTERNKR